MANTVTATAMQTPFAFSVSNGVDAAELAQWRGSSDALAACQSSCTRSFATGWCSGCYSRYNGSLHCYGIDCGGIGWYKCDWFC